MYMEQGNLIIRDATMGQGTQCLKMLIRYLFEAQGFH